MMLDPQTGWDEIKPVVCILFCGEVRPEILQSVGWGLEEEGIPASMDRVVEDNPAAALAKRAACQSRLHVGIGISARFQEAALHHRDLPDEKPLLVATLRPEAQEERIRFGKNAARLVKGNPLSLGIDYLSHDKTGADPEWTREVIENAVSRIMEAIRNGTVKKEKL